MALLTDFTTYAEIRSALGVDEDELDDSTLGLDLYVLGLIADLEDIAADLPDDYEEVRAIDESARTKAQQRFYSAVRLFAPYAVAMLLASGLPLFAPKSITDGKAGVTRDSNQPYKETIDTCKERYDAYRLRLAARYSDVGGSSTTPGAFPLFSVVTPASDPVTGT